MTVIGQKIVLRLLFLQRELRSLAARRTVEIILGTVSQFVRMHDVGLRGGAGCKVL